MTTSEVTKIPLQSEKNTWNYYYQMVEKSIYIFDSIAHAKLHLIDVLYYLLHLMIGVLSTIKHWVNQDMCLRPHRSLLLDHLIDINLKKTGDI